MKLGHDFGSTPFGTDLAAAAVARDDDCCSCERWFLENEVFALGCSVHGLAATLRAAVATLREDEEAAA